VQQDTDRYGTSQRLVACLTSADNLLTTDTTLSYVAPVATVQERQVAADPKLKVWVEAVRAARGRTGDHLGTRYPRISEPLWTAVQAALSGAATPPEALAAAQATASAR
jgi:multiple sugar transport system substrate-binding protein